MIAVDTNVLIYACDSGAGPKHDRSLELLGTIADGVLLWQVACEFIAAARKLAPRGLSPAFAWDRLRDFQSVFPLQLPAPEILDLARTLHLDHQCAFWDAMIFASCLNADVTRIYSEDLPGAPISGLEVVNPFAFPQTG